MKKQKNEPLLKIGVDLMGSDHPPSLFLDTVLSFSKTCPDVFFILIGTPNLQLPFNKKKDPSSKNLSFLPVKEYISMGEHPLLAIRRKKDSSLIRGMLLLKEKKIHAFVSAGNTGALMTSANIFLPRLPTIQRPALLALMPTKKKLLAVLDVGANIHCKTKHLIQFAKLGSLFQKKLLKKTPNLGLLNIGSEQIKGSSELQKTYQELFKLEKSSSLFSFKGNVEGKEVFEGDIDVLVTDGFTGNVFLKTAEGTASFLLDKIKDLFPDKNIFFNDLQKKLHYSEYPGAILLGVDGLVVKCHGYSSPKALQNALNGVIELARSDLMAFLKKELKRTPKHN